MPVICNPINHLAFCQLILYYLSMLEPGPKPTRSPEIIIRALEEAAKKGRAPTDAREAVNAARKVWRDHDDQMNDRTRDPLED